MIEKILKLELEKKNLVLSDIYLKKILNKKIDNLELEKILINLNLINLYNFTIILKNLYPFISFSQNNEIEEKFYSNLSETDREWHIVKNVQITLENTFNDLISNETDILDEKQNSWVCVSLDSFYEINFNYIKLDESTSQKILPRTKNIELAFKILKYNIIVSTLDRIEGVIFYNKLKKDNDSIPDKLKTEIPFTKGYAICFHPDLIKILKNCKYSKKMLKNKPTKISIKRELLTFEALSNEFYSSPIWMKNESVYNILKYQKMKEDSENIIYNKKILYEKFPTDRVVKLLNYLNSIKLTYNKKIFSELYLTVERNQIIDKTLATRNSTYVYITSSLKKLDTPFNTILNTINENETFETKTLINSTGSLELIKKQLNYFKFFYLNHKLDSRLRIYCWQWPVNYQLSHIIRLSILFTKKIEISKIYENFFNHPLIINYKSQNKLFMQESVDELFLSDIKKNFNLLEINNVIELKIKLECIIILLTKIAPKKINNLNKKIEFALKNYKNFIKSNLIKEWKKWLNIFNFSNKKLPYLIHLKHTLKDAEKGVFKNTFWADASSNAIQLISLRLGVKNNKLLMLTNIINNTTEYENIYAYVTDQIKKQNHNEILNKINNKITVNELNNLQNDEINKYLIMPSSYGMGKNTFRKRIQEMIRESGYINIWNKLNKEESKTLSDYFWDSAHLHLKEIEFDLEKYKHICNSLWKNNTYSIFSWKNDLDIPVCPVNFKTSKRRGVLNKINFLKLQKKQTLDKEKKEILQKKLKLAEKKLEIDSKKYWKRTMINTNNQKIFARIYYNPFKEIDTHKTRQSLIPNSIHSYDASVICKTLEICKELKIQVLPIHDSLGCNILLIPLIKILFKAVNIEILKQTEQRAPFPFEETLEDGYTENLKNELIKSQNFFR